MRYVKFDPRNLDVEEIDDTEKAEFRSWFEKADAAARKAVEEYEKYGTPPKEPHQERGVVNQGFRPGP
jgi:predicted transcriptional regulator YdeE